MLCNFADTLKKSHMENNKKNKLYYVSTADLIKLMNDVMNADKKSASEIIGIDEVCRITGLSKHTISLLSRKSG